MMRSQLRSLEEASVQARSQFYAADGEYRQWNSAKMLMESGDFALAERLAEKDK